MPPRLTTPQDLDYFIQRNAYRTQPQAEQKDQDEQQTQGQEKPYPPGLSITGGFGLGWQTTVGHGSRGELLQLLVVVKLVVGSQIRVEDLHQVQQHHIRVGYAALIVVQTAVLIRPGIVVIDLIV